MAGQQMKESTPRFEIRMTSDINAMALVVIVFGTVQAFVTGFSDMLVSRPVGHEKRPRLPAV